MSSVTEAERETREKPSRRGFYQRLTPLRLLCLCMLALLPAVYARGQVKTPAERMVVGTVVNGSGVPADRAVVYLQDTKSMVIRSYVANGGGHFHFNQLAPDTDYQVWAEINKRRSKIRTISMFNSHTRFTYTLKVKADSKPQA